MNISNLEQDLSTLVSRIEQMEHQHAVLKKYVLGIKRKLDNLIDKFEGRPEVQIMESLQWELVDLQNFFQQNVYLTQNNAKIKNYAISEFAQNRTEAVLEASEIATTQNLKLEN